MSENKSYNKNRDFSKTPEPESESKTETHSRAKPLFVIQKHDASTLHYDFRIEIEGVLKSWVLPKGPSTDPSQKRLAIPTEDHPLEYADFEGIIPEDQYGGGTVMIWDKGEFSNINTQNGKTVPLGESYKNGHIVIYLEGEKISGGYTLIQTKSGKLDDNWLLIKMDDDKADARRNPTSAENRSVKSGQTLEEIKSTEQKSS